jgi:hypothetical protein
MPAIYELRSQLSDRANRLRYLISFVRENGLMSKVSHRVASVCGVDRTDHAVQSQTPTAECREGSSSDRIMGSPKSTDGVRQAWHI